MPGNAESHQEQSGSSNIDTENPEAILLRELNEMPPPPYKSLGFPETGNIPSFQSVPMQSEESMAEPMIHRARGRAIVSTSQLHQAGNGEARSGGEKTFILFGCAAFIYNVFEEATYSTMHPEASGILRVLRGFIWIFCMALSFIHFCVIKTSGNRKWYSYLFIFFAIYGTSFIVLNSASNGIVAVLQRQPRNTTIPLK